MLNLHSFKWLNDCPKILRSAGRNKPNFERWVVPREWLLSLFALNTASVLGCKSKFPIRYRMHSAERK